MKEKEKVHNMMPSRDKALLFAEWLEEKQAFDLVALDVAGSCPVTETILLASAKGVRHAQGLADMLLDRASENKIEYLGMEGYQGGGWILVDMNDVVVHIFLEEHRGLYNIEGLWSEAEDILRSSEDGGHELS